MSVLCQELFMVHRTAEGDAAALQGLTLEADAGEMLAVLGPSGSGKSTLLRILAGLQRPSAGRAVVAGHDMARLGVRARARVRRAHIGFVGQHAEFALSPVMTIEESLRTPLQLRGVGAAPARRRAAELIEGVGLAPAVLAVRPHELSGGEAQRAAVCVALAHRPDVVLADEPTGELDAGSARQVLTLLRELADDGASTVVLVTHDPVGADMAHRVVRVRDGRVSAEDAGNRRAVVIGKGGWLHVPQELLDKAGIGNRALARADADAVILEPVAGTARAEVDVADGDRATVAAARPERVEGATVTLRGISKAYGSRVVFDGADFEFAPGSFTAVTGRSGSGKSTLLRMVAGLESADAGEITVADRPLAGLAREELAALRASTVGFVAQDLRLPGFMSARELVMLPLLQGGWPRERAEDAAHRWLSAIGLTERLSQRAARLSSGERQRVALARVVAAGRRVLLVDEPTSRLDEANAAAVAALLRATAEDYGITVLCATHDPVIADAAHERVPL